MAQWNMWLMVIQWFPSSNHTRFYRTIIDVTFFKKQSLWSDKTWQLTKNPTNSTDAFDVILTSWSWVDIFLFHSQLHNIMLHAVMLTSLSNQLLLPWFVTSGRNKEIKKLFSLLTCCEGLIAWWKNTPRGFQVLSILYHLREELVLLIEKMS